MRRVHFIYIFIVLVGVIVMPDEPWWREALAITTLTGAGLYAGMSDW